MTRASKLNNYSRGTENLKLANLGQIWHNRLPKVLYVHLMLSQDGCSILTCAPCNTCFPGYKVVAIAKATTINEPLALFRSWVVEVSAEGCPARASLGGEGADAGACFPGHTPVAQLHRPTRAETARDTERNADWRTLNIVTRGRAGRATGGVNFVPQAWGDRFSLPRGGWYWKRKNDLVHCAITDVWEKASGWDIRMQSSNSFSVKRQWTYWYLGFERRVGSLFIAHV